MAKLKIAVFIDWFLPGTKAGGPVRSVYSLMAVLKNYFDFYLITANTDLGENKPYKNIPPNELFEKDGIHYFYFDQTQLNKTNILQLIQSIQPDLIYSNSFWSLPFSINLVRLKHAKQITVPVLLAPRGMLGTGARSLKWFKKDIFILAAKFFGWYKQIVFHATQAQEEADIRKVFPNATVRIAGNINALSSVKNTSDKKQGHLRLFYLSRIAKVKNLHFALQVLKDIPNTCQIDYHIFGNLEDKTYWESCEKIIDQLPANIHVVRENEISFDKIANVIPSFHCLFLPTLNENFGHAIVESLLCGCPVIISDQTPWNDLQNYGAGFAFDLNKPQLFANAIQTYAKLNQEDFNNVSAAAQKYIADKINIHQTVEQYKNLFNDCIKN